ncbi:T-lymphocyte surface antigen Ly-9-like [Anoplopoma fimbria]|uniref:T-lymphocyte surface antigen Ly-9-like n=1 Tax=Anoplopoma fimbria TaxID=229290 RepID=UPI0023EB1957|nr:T-lymphocyte surface antigen Ly-9-like [Anoplopoma fimbria]
MWAGETSMGVPAWLCVFLAVVTSDTEIKVYKKVGDDVVIKPGNTAVSSPITHIVWIHVPNIAAQFDKEGLDLYHQFQKRGNLNISNGEFTITGLTRNDSGLYTAEINNVVKRPNILLTVISPVPKPIVSVSCDDERTSCTLTCDGDTTDAKPVTYSWRSDDKVTAQSKELQITKNESLGVEKFSCEIKNPVSLESSLSIPNPLYTISAPPRKPNISLGVIVLVILLVSVILLVAVHRCKTGVWFFQKSSMPWEPNFWRKNERPPRDAAGSNGKENVETEEETPLS